MSELEIFDKKLIKCAKCVRPTPKCVRPTP